MTTYRVMGRSGPIGRGLTRELADDLADVSGGTVEVERAPNEMTAVEQAAFSDLGRAGREIEEDES